MDLDYQYQDYPPVLFTTFKSNATSKEVTKTSCVSSDLKHNHPGQLLTEAQAEPKDAESMTKLTSSSKGIQKAISEKPAGTLKEQTQQWFEKSQRRRLLKNGQFPEWFHGFITRRRAEDMLQEKPVGCFLIRFCESRVGYVLSYRGTERCRHFMLDQLEDDRYVIQGESSTHSQLRDLLKHYSTSPVEPYREVLTTACANKNNTGCLQNCLEPTTERQTYSAMKKERQVPSHMAPSVATPSQENKNCPSPGQMQVQLDIPPVSEEEFDKCSTHEDHPSMYAQVDKTSAPCMQAKPETTSQKQKYSTLEEPHTYAEPASCNPQYHKVHEPIAFYAMGRGSCNGGMENVYCEVDRQCVGSPNLKMGAQRPAVSATLPQPKKKAVQNTHAFHASFRLPKLSTSLPEDLMTRGKTGGSSSKPFCKSKASQQQKNPKMQFDDPQYGNNTSKPGNPCPAPTLTEDPENIYEKIPEDRALKPRNSRSAKRKTS
ncbi:SH2 domain-containing protein 2A isoform X2 [Ascaphus truei]|uniref:SH2 domain-containing protein 2A isoform X2 n=1 Tax=Ascaphus truei TaxID=8439 RepID=UPI003F5A908C